MKYLIQIFRPVTEAKLPDEAIGLWSNTAWGTDNYIETKAVAEKIASSNKIGITRVRVLEKLIEIECK